MNEPIRNCVDCFAEITHRGTRCSVCREKHNAVENMRYYEDKKTGDMCSKCKIYPAWQDQPLCVSCGRWVVFQDITPPAYRGASVRDVDDNGYKVICHYLQLGGLIYIHGSTGTGKTRLLWALALNHFIRSGKLQSPIMYATVDLCSEINSTISRYGNSEKQAFIRRLCNQNYLLIDDLGAEKGTEKAKENLGFIIQERHLWHRHTAITSNLMTRELVGAYDDRMASRVAENCVVQVTGDDRRVRRNEQEYVVDFDPNFR